VDWKKLVLVAAAVLAAGYLGARLGFSSRGDVALAGGGGSNNIIAFSTDSGGNQDGNRIVIINPAKNKILVYRLNMNDMGLIVVRGYEYDQELLWTPSNPPGIGYTYEQIKTQVEAARKAAGLAPGAP
jgi:hypothetical protein